MIMTHDPGEQESYEEEQLEGGRCIIAEGAKAHEAYGYNDSQFCRVWYLKKPEVFYMLYLIIGFCLVEAMICGAAVLTHLQQ